MNYFSSLGRCVAALLLLAAATRTAQAQTNGVGIGIATPRAGLDVNHDSGVLATGTFGTGTIPVEGPGTRLLWYPAKAAFRAGIAENVLKTSDTPPAGFVEGATAWDDFNTGPYSTAFGQSCQASGDYSLAVGHDCKATGNGGIALGYECVASGTASVALGYGANTNVRQGCFVFADRSAVGSFRSPANHSAYWRVVGGFRVVTGGSGTDGYTPTRGVSILPGTTSGLTTDWGQPTALIATSSGAYLSSGGTWTNSSDRRKKHQFEPVSGEDVLARLRRVPLTSWSYKADPATVRHLGPMAQDFRKAFGLGQDSISIGTVDADGVALAAAQALDARTRRQADQLAGLQAENQVLRTNLDALRTRLDALEQPAASPATAALPWLGGLLLLGFAAQALRRRPARG